MTRSSPDKRARPHLASFSLVELLVAMAIASVLILVLTALASTALTSTAVTNNSLVALSDANAAMNLLATDLNGLKVIRQPMGTCITNGTYVVPGYVEYLQAWPETNAINNTTPIRLMMLCTSPQDSYTNSVTAGPDMGLPRLVCYRVLYQDPLNTTTGTAKLFGLYRQVASSAVTASNLNNWMTAGGSPLLTYWNTNSPGTTNFIAENVVDFQCVAYANPISNGTYAQPPLAVYTSCTDATNATPTGFQLKSNSPNGGVSGYGPIAYVEVTVVVLDARGAKLWGTGTGTGAKSPAALKLKYGHTLTRKIILRTY